MKSLIALLGLGAIGAGVYMMLRPKLVMKAAASAPNMLAPAQQAAQAASSAQTSAAQATAGSSGLTNLTDMLWDTSPHSGWIASHNNLRYTDLPKPTVSTLG